MKKEDIIRAWKDPEFRASLSEEEREALPENPAGKELDELDEEELQAVAGGAEQVEDPGDGNYPTISADCTGGPSCWPGDWF